MKILQVGKFYPIRGGVEKVMYDLMLGLSAQGIDCDMLCATTEGHPGGEFRLNAHARLICIKTTIKAAATMLAPGMVGKLRAIAGSYDIIHIHHPDPMAALSLYLSGYKGKVVLHWHSDILKQKMLLKFYKPLQNWLISRADLIVGTSPVYVRESGFLQQVQHKVAYIPIGVEPVQINVTDSEKIRSRYAGKKIIFSLGRLVEYKGYAYLVKAAMVLDDVKILIGGKGPLHEELLALAKSCNVEDKVEFIGFIADEDLPAYYGACDIFVLSSILKTEAFAIVQIEAMSCGKPVISTRIPGSGVSWVNADGISGITVPIEDEVALAAAIQQVLTDGNYYQSLSDGAKNRYNEWFTRARMVEKSLHLYEKIL